MMEGQILFSELAGLKENSGNNKSLIGKLMCFLVSLD